MGNVWYIVILCIGILYVLNPIDLVPDVIPILGWIDDLLVFAVAWWLINRMRTWVPADADAKRDEASRRSQANGDTLRDPSAASLPKTPWQLLDIEPGASDETIDAAYKAQLMQYHPDRVAHLGEDLQRLAHEKTLEIQRAYEHIKRRRT
jgi:DnaJ like chaperone protein